MNIVDKLKEEKELLEELLDILKKEKDALMKDDVVAVDELSKRKLDINEKFMAIEKQRELICNGKALKDIIIGLDQREKIEAENIKADIEKLVYSISEHNETNNLLIKQTLNYIRAMINIVAPPKASVYSQTGKVNASASLNFVNRSI